MTSTPVGIPFLTSRTAAATTMIKPTIHSARRATVHAGVLGGDGNRVMVASRPVRTKPASDIMPHNAVKSGLVGVAPEARACAISSGTTRGSEPLATMTHSPPLSRRDLAGLKRTNESVTVPTHP